jgi:hypothetical protein
MSRGQVSWRPVAVRQIDFPRFGVDTTVSQAAEQALGAMVLHGHIRLESP